MAFGTRRPFLASGFLELVMRETLVPSVFNIFNVATREANRLPIAMTLTVIDALGWDQQIFSVDSGAAEHVERMQQEVLLTVVDCGALHQRNLSESNTESAWMPRRGRLVLCSGTQSEFVRRLEDAVQGGATDAEVADLSLLPQGR